MKIVFLTNSLGFAGAEKMLTFVANSLSDRGHECVIINLNSIGDYINENKQAVNESIKVYTFDRQTGGARHKNRIERITDICKEANADIVIGFTGWPNFYAKVVGSRLHIPSIMSERGDPARTTTNTLKAKLIDFAVNRSKGGVFQTDGAKEYYGKGLQKRGIVIPNPIFVKGEIPDVAFEEREKSVVSVGRLDNEQKRYDIMIEAFKLFSAKHPEYILKLYGRGVDEERIKQWAVDAGIEDKVKLMGLTSQPMQDIATDGMFLITSDYEGISNSLLEAMAVGLPCVSTDHTPGGARLLITDHKNGLLAPIADSEALAKAMCEFAENPVLAKDCGEKAKDVLNRFAPHRIIDMWEEYIVKLCTKK